MRAIVSLGKTTSDGPRTWALTDYLNIGMVVLFFQRSELHLAVYGGGGCTHLPPPPPRYQNPLLPQEGLHYYPCPSILYSIWFKTQAEQEQTCVSIFI